MSKKTAFIYSPAYLNYGFGEEHPFNPRRLTMTIELCTASGILNPSDIIEPQMAAPEQLEIFHSKEYINAVSLGIPAPEFGLTDEDNPVTTPHLHTAAAHIVGGTILAGELLITENYDHVFNIGGGLHHAQKAFCSGFCIYNDLAIAILHLRKKYGLKVAYLDLDAHHGDGVQNAFYADPDVLTISIHETGRYLFPGTGTIFERGTNGGYSYCVNIPLDAFSESDSYIYVLDNVVYPLLEEFQPDILVVQCGCDAHLFDPLTHLALTIDGFITIYKKIHHFAHEFTNGKLLCTGGGGYNPWQVVPRAWTALWSEITERTAPTQIPAALIKKWSAESKKQIPARLTDRDSFCIAIPRRDEIREKNIMTANKVISSTLFHWRKTF